jgi:hypothetical protein
MDEVEKNKPILSANKGRVLRNDNCPNKLNSKTKRHRGWITSRWAKPGKYKEAILDGVDSTYYFDPWNDGRDGIHFDRDRSHIRNKFMRRYYNEAIVNDNQKLKKLLKVRAAKKSRKLFSAQ